MDRMILPLFGALFLLLLGAVGPLAWDRHPPIGWHARVFGMSVAGFDLPDSLVTQRDKALAQAAVAVHAGAQCRLDLASLTGAVAAQNAAVAALRRDEEARVARSARATAAARAVAASERAHVQAILDARPASRDLCRAAEQLIDDEASR